MTKTYRSEAVTAIHETMEALHQVGALDKQTMREFDDACLTPARYNRRKSAPSASGKRCRSRCSPAISM